MSNDTSAVTSSGANLLSPSQCIQCFFGVFTVCVVSLFGGRLLSLYIGSRYGKYNKIYNLYLWLPFQKSVLFNRLSAYFYVDGHSICVIVACLLVRSS